MIKPAKDSRSPNLDKLPEDIRNYIIRQEKRIRQLEALLEDERPSEGPSTSKDLLTLFDQLQYGVLEESQSGIITYGNPNFWRIFRLSIPPDEIIGTPIDVLLLELKGLFRNPTQFQESIREIIQNKELVISHSFELNSGKIIEVEYLPNYRSNTYLGQLLVFKDVTQIRQSGHQIAQLKLQLEGILNASTSGIIAFRSVRNAEGDLVDFEVMASNSAAENKLGRKIVLQMLGKNLIDSLNTEGQNDLFARYRSVVETGLTLDHEYAVTTKNETIWVHSVAVKLEDGFVVTFSDITTAKEATRILREQSNVLHGITDNIPVVIYKLDNQGIYKEIFGAGLQALHRKESDLVGLNMIDRQPHLRPYFQRAMAGERVTFVNAGVTGGYEWCFENYVFKDPYSDGVLGFALDITAKSRAEKELLEAKMVAEESMKAKEIFLANMSHEIRTPMNGILGMAQLLSRTNLEAQQANYLNIITKSAENLLVILNDILDLAKIESGKLQFEQIPFDLGEVAETAIQSFVYKADEKAIVLRCECSALAFSHVLGDPYRLNQVLVNLLSNAIKFTDKGRVLLHVATAESTDSHTKVTFSVHDTGIGIPQEQIGQLFKQFTQADTGIGRKYGGTGLGLNISKNLIERQGGTIQVQSTPGVGSVFSFTIPYPIDHSAHKRPDQTKQASLASILIGKKILLAEDNEINLFYARTILENWGCIVTIAQNGHEAVDWLEKNSFDLVLMDIQMPLMNGIEATNRIRTMQDVDKANTPILALTANALAGDHEHYLKAGMNDSLTKPFKEEELLSKITQLITGVAVQVAESKQVNRTSSETNLYDLSRIEEIAKGNQSFVASMVQLFVETSEENLQTLQDHFKSQNWMLFRESAHKFKASLDTLGVASHYHTIRTLEKYEGEVELIQEVRQMLKSLEETVRNIQVHLRRQLDEWKAKQH